MDNFINIIKRIFNKILLNVFYREKKSPQEKRKMKDILVYKEYGSLHNIFVKKKRKCLCPICLFC